MDERFEKLPRFSTWLLSWVCQRFTSSRWSRRTFRLRFSSMRTRPALGCAQLWVSQLQRCSTLLITGPQASLPGSAYNAPLAIRYPPDIRPRPLPGLIFSNIRPRSVTNWISTCGLNRFATWSLRSAECHRVKPTANLQTWFASLVKSLEHSW